MTTLSKAQLALQMIRSVLNNDRDYQSPELKLGAIWGWCNHAASYRQGQSAEGTYVEVLERAADQPGESL